MITVCVVCRYMAIEMMMLRIQRHEDRRGYTNAVDWWSLGVTMFVLLTGLKPFPQLNTSSVALLAKLIETDPAYKAGTRVLLENNPDMKDVPMEYMYINDKLAGLKHVAPDTINIILQLLDFNEHTRLGSRMAGGIKTLKEHPFFKWELTPAEGKETKANGGGRLSGFQMSAGNKVSQSNIDHSNSGGDGSVSGRSMSANDSVAVNAQSMSPVLSGGKSCDSDKVGGESSKDTVGELPMTSAPPERNLEYCWDFIEQKQILPPFTPAEAEINEEPAYNSFDEMMMGIDKVSWLKQYPSTYYDEYFQNW